ncbi:MAG: OmpA family protein [Candidatus Aminicenantes bacterium]|nr:OmpA family protein [Candidatus Aminicenantes bacterium]
MEKNFKLVICFLFLLSVSGPTLHPQQDVDGSQDHPLLSRMDNFYISEYQFFNYDSHEFYDAEDNEYVIEGQKWVIDYTLKEGFESPGQLMVEKNHINAIRKIGGTILYERGVTMKVTQEDKEIWIDLWVSSDGSDYRLTIVETKAMEQEVTADPEALAGDIESTGRAVVYGIFFDFDSAVIKPESEPTFQAIAEMLNSHSMLKVYVVGHTDMTGSLDYNMDLSLDRARAVVQKLIKEFGISGTRLQAKGAGPLCPVSSNQTEEGRKLNRRVELVQIITKK